MTPVPSLQYLELPSSGQSYSGFWEGLGLWEVASSEESFEGSEGDVPEKSTLLE